ncbi:MAG TPA: hypothetical protein VGQ69_09905 [Gemmatimonadales bacterium]|jgi:hypothetical protein|nr:hypothetical protein [Gemmatimonadales bacterium]
MTTDRREFLGMLAAAGIVGKAGGNLPSSRAPIPSSPWDVSWADRITGKHRAVFDSVEISAGLGLLRALIWMKDYGEVYGATPAELSAVVVLRHNAIWLVMDDEFWAHHKIGALTKITDPKTKQPIERNPVIGPNPFGLPPALADDGLKKVLASGTVLACNLALTLDVVEQIKADLKLDDAKAREMALKHLVPGVILQPSGVFATLRAQEAGCQYLLATDA